MELHSSAVNKVRGNSEQARVTAPGPDKRAYAGLLLLAMSVALMASGPTWAQATPDQIDQANREIERIQQEQRERLENDRRERESQQPRTQIELPVAPEGTATEGGPCRDIKRIQIEGAALMSEDDQRRLAAPFVGTCMDVADIERLLGSITNYYIRDGYIGARAYIQTQDLNEGVLRILVVEGEVSELRLDDGNNRSVNLATAFPGVLGQPFNLRDFEQGLDQVNRLLSNRATLAIEPGARPGDTVVVIRNEPSDVLNANLTLDNFGSDSTGETQAGFAILVDNLAHSNDNLMVSHRRSLTADYSAQHSYTSSFLYSVPYGYFTTTASQVLNRYATTVDLPSISLLAEGNSSTSALQVSYVAHRDQINSLWLESTLTVKDNNNFFAGEKLQVSSLRFSNVNLRATWNTHWYGGALSVGLDYVLGVKWFGGYDDPANLPSDAPRAQFEKWQSLMTWTKPFDMRERRYVYSSSVSSQWSSDVLYGQEQFLVGSIFSVRGFRDTSISGDRGVYWRNDLSAPFSAEIGSTVVGLRPLLGLDVGRIYPHEFQRGGTLAGATAGLGISVWQVVMDLKAVAPLHKPDRFDHEGAQIYFNVRYSY